MCIPISTGTNGLKSIPETASVVSDQFQAASFAPIPTSQSVKETSSWSPSLVDFIVHLRSLFKATSKFKLLVRILISTVSCNHSTNVLNRGSQTSLHDQRQRNSSSHLRHLLSHYLAPQGRLRYLQHPPSPHGAHANHSSPRRWCSRPSRRHRAS